ncbi:GntR family transcriptional regulator [Pseudovibrio flavus]|uniref:GntR family transcriptional regulator n=1 Tax=Pseudovibrio flavus TaxID=2529854 RepID=UPI00211C37A3|nr:GntR family transcriptional regulator [Pseudovibrio flavus]
MIDRSKPIAPQVYDVLRNAITRYELPPESQINEPELANTLGVSRTPLRQAYQKLAEEELIISRPQVGSIVAPIDNKKIREGIIIRRALEREVVRILCETSPSLTDLDPILAVLRVAMKNKDAVGYFNADQEFHQKLAELADIPAAWRLSMSVKGHSDRARLHLMIKNSARLERAYNEHLELIGAISTGDIESAEAIINRHVSATTDAYRQSN